MSAVTLHRPWLTFDLGGEMQVLSWAINKPGFVTARRILWREVRNRDLPEHMDVLAWLDGELTAANAQDSVCFLTSRDIGHVTQHTAHAGAVSAQCVATVGLGNAERVGQRVARHADEWGTINIAVALTCAMSKTGLIEASSIATQARTVAIIDAGLTIATGRATGTGTDCIAIAAPKGDNTYAGLHTDVGEAIGAAVYRATLTGAQGWIAENAKAAEQGNTPC